MAQNHSTLASQTFRLMWLLKCLSGGIYKSQMGGLVEL